MEKIGIVVAMEEEYSEIEKIITSKKSEKICNIDFVEGEIKNKSCILTKSGVGKVNAAMTTQILIDKFDIDYILNVGVAGAINSNMKIGDVIIGEYVVQHDFDITEFNHPKGYITGIGDKVLCDEKLISKFNSSIQKNKSVNYVIKNGIVATGDIFVTDIKMKEKIRKKFNADVVDMECGAIAQVSHLNNKPFLVIRAISDCPNGNNAKTFDENLELASKRCADVLQELL